MKRRCQLEHTQHEYQLSHHRGDNTQIRQRYFETKGTTRREGIDLPLSETEKDLFLYTLEDLGGIDLQKSESLSERIYRPQTGGIQNEHDYTIEPTKTTYTETMFPNGLGTFFFIELRVPDRVRFSTIFKMVAQVL